METKGEISKELKEKFGITEERLFSDFTGFAQSNAHDRPYRDYSAEDYFYLGMMFRQRGDLEKAIEACDKALELNPQFAEANALRGAAKHILGDLVDAIADFDKALELAPNDMRVYRNRGIAKRLSGDHQGAIADFDNAIELAPEYARAYRHRGRAKRALGNEMGAQADFAKAQELDPSLEPPEPS